MKTLTGIAAAPGIAIGPAFNLGDGELAVERRPVTDLEAEWSRFQAAAGRAEQELSDLCSRVDSELGSDRGAIFGAQIMILQDPALLNGVQQEIRSQRLNAEAATSDVIERYAARLAQVDDPYIRARAVDIRDVGERLLRIMLGQPKTATADLCVPAIVLADDLTPSETVLLDRELVLGFCTARGGVTSHAAILAQGLGLPAVVGVGPALQAIENGTPLVLDGNGGLLQVAPDARERARAETRQRAWAARQATAHQQAARSAVTADGQPVEVFANIGCLADALPALQVGAEGVGLLRTEFLFLGRDHVPDEDEQFEVYRAILQTFGDRPVILRTLDIGGDKHLPYLELPRELNPFLGQRGLRLCLQRPELLKPQLRAALRASVHGQLKLMFPMVSTGAEIDAACRLLAECRRELLAERIKMAPAIDVGIMVEVPAAALLANQLLQGVDFCSIGTNDLAQYTLAADRTNAAVAGLADAFHPAVLQLVRDVISAAGGCGKGVGLCGDLAGRPLAVPILLGLGLREFSVAAPLVPATKEAIRAVDLATARHLAAQALQLSSADEVRTLVLAQYPALAPD